jgi:DNA-binding NtrC family response regulator
MFKNIEEYIKLSREERRNHLRLNEKCIEIGGYDSREYRGLLAHFLQTTIPTKAKQKIMLCHACNNPKCSNVNHLYWGLTRDNTIDSKENGTWKNMFSRTVNKYGEEKAKELNKAAASKGGKGNKGRKNISKEQETLYKNTIIRYMPFKNGDITKISKELRLSHTHVTRLIKKYENHN